MILLYINGGSKFDMVAIIPICINQGNISVSEWLVILCISECCTNHVANHVWVWYQISFVHELATKQKIVVQEKNIKMFDKIIFIVNVY